MAFKLSNFEIGMIAAFVVATGAGIGGYVYTDGLVQTAKQEMSDAGAALQKLTKVRYQLSDSNIKALDGNINQLEAALKPIQEKVFLNTENKLSLIEAKNPVTWKNSDLDPTVQKLVGLAKNKRVVLPADYYFGFARFQKANPSEQATLILGKQLYGIEQLATILFNANEGGGITSLMAIQRTLDEEGATPGGGDGGEAVKGSVQTSPNGLYQIYPFQVVFTGNTAGLRTFLNSLFESPTLFIVRSVQVTNTKIESPKVADLGKGLQDGNRAGAGLGRDFIFGSEQLQIRVRVDMIEWLGTKPPQPAAR